MNGAVVVVVVRSCNSSTTSSIIRLFAFKTLITKYSINN
jgi:hypothetical protein